MFFDLFQKHFSLCRYVYLQAQSNQGMFMYRPKVISIKQWGSIMFQCYFPNYTTLLRRFYYELTLEACVCVC